MADRAPVDIDRITHEAVLAAMQPNSGASIQALVAAIRRRRQGAPDPYAVASQKIEGVTSRVSAEPLPGGVYVAYTGKLPGGA